VSSRALRGHTYRRIQEVVIDPVLSTKGALMSGDLW